MPRRVAEMRRSFFCSGKSLDSAASDKPQDYHTHTRAYVQAHVSAPMRLRRHAHLNIKIPIFPIKISIKINFRSQTTPAKKTIARFKKRATFFISFCISQFMQSPLASRIREPNTKIKHISNNARGKKQRTAAEKIILAKDCFSRSFQRTLPGGINLRARNNRWKRALSSRFPQATLSA